MTGNIINRAEAALTGKTVLKKLGIRKCRCTADGLLPGTRRGECHC